MEKKYKKRLSKYLKPINIGKALEDELGSISLGDDLFSRTGKDGKKLFLRTFGENDLYTIMEDVGLIPHLASLGFSNFSITIDIDESYIHYLKLYESEAIPENMLLDLRLSETRFFPDKKFFDEKVEPTSYDMVVIEWLSSQNPQNRFTSDKPQLPGQRKPGLGILKYCFKMMYEVAKEITKDGFLDIPDHVHGAIMYSRAFKFFDPAHEGVIRALMRDLKDYSLSDISWGIITGTIIETYKKEPQPYDPSEQIFYVSERMRAYFHSHKYLSVYNKYYKRKHFRFHYDEMVKKRDKILKGKSIEDL